MKCAFVYILTNKNKTTLYIGVTNDLVRRIYEHKNHVIKNSFTDRYNLEYCIYYEEFQDFDLAIQREKELKKWSRQKKEDLINKKNPEWKELIGGTDNGKQIPHYVRDDNSSASGKEESGDGVAAFLSLYKEKARHFERSEKPVCNNTVLDCRNGQ